LLGHVSIRTTERYLVCKQKLRFAVNDRTGIEPGQSTGFAVVSALDRPPLGNKAFFIGGPSTPQATKRPAELQRSRKNQIAPNIQ